MSNFKIQGAKAPLLTPMAIHNTKAHHSQIKSINIRFEKPESMGAHQNVAI